MNFIWKSSGRNKPNKPDLKSRAVPRDIDPRINTKTLLMNTKTKHKDPADKHHKDEIHKDEK
jgi:hypothetical protein